MSGWTSSSYVIGPVPQAVHRITTSRTEIVHLLVAFAVLTFDIALLQRGIGQIFVFTPSAVAASVAALELGGAVALTGFVAHELAHKIAAQRFGFWAEFRMSPMGLFLSLVTSAVGFLFALPGATVIGGMGDVNKWGRTSLVGPLLNLVEGTVFLSVSAVLLRTLATPGPAVFFLLLGLFNGIFAGFNLLPFGLLDGRKVLHWNVAIWAVSFAAAVIFVVYAYAVVLGAAPLF